MTDHADPTDPDSGPDPVLDSDRGRGTTPPETGSESTNVVGRPAVEPAPAAFHEPAETEGLERKPFNEREALEQGGSFDGIAPPGS